MSFPITDATGSQWNLRPDGDWWTPVASETSDVLIYLRDVKTATHEDREDLLKKATEALGHGTLRRIGNIYWDDGPKTVQGNDDANVLFEEFQDLISLGRHYKDTFEIPDDHSDWMSTLFAGTLQSERFRSYSKEQLVGLLLQWSRNWNSVRYRCLHYSLREDVRRRANLTTPALTNLAIDANQAIHESDFVDDTALQDLALMAAFKNHFTWFYVFKSEEARELVRFARAENGLGQMFAWMITYIDNYMDMRRVILSQVTRDARRVAAAATQASKDYYDDRVPLQAPLVTHYTAVTGRVVILLNQYLQHSGISNDVFQALCDSITSLNTSVNNNRLLHHTANMTPVILNQGLINR
ncbi:hypothetical protein BJ170DRAFT_201329 [Xylariales sp. AK1849]|nr:hypothetical protein BJ170DRAFT_201329 [Xylariales sp. AK1849]